MSFEMLYAEPFQRLERLLKGFTGTMSVSLRDGYPVMVRSCADNQCGVEQFEQAVQLIAKVGWGELVLTVENGVIRKSCLTEHHKTSSS